MFRLTKLFVIVSLIGFAASTLPASRQKPTPNSTHLTEVELAETVRLLIGVPEARASLGVCFTACGLACDAYVSNPCLKNLCYKYCNATFTPTARIAGCAGLSTTMTTCAETRNVLAKIYADVCVATRGC